MAATRKPRKPPVRTVECGPAPLGAAADYHVVIRTDGAWSGYWLRRLASAFGVAYEFTQGNTNAPRGEYQAESYDVCVEADADHCGCPGHERHGHCKHAWALRTLLGRGELAGAPRLDAYKPAGHSHGIPF